MKLTVHLAGTNIGITFLNRSKKIVPLCRQFFTEFLHPDPEADAKITVSVLKNLHPGFPVRASTGNPVFEQLLATQDVVAWLRDLPDYKEDFPITEKTISSFCLDGLLLFNPDTSSGRIYLLKQGPVCFKPIFRIFWMYFAQVLGESGCCFVHGAAVVKDNAAYLFLGDSGAGKSTVARLCTEGTVISDDSPILHERKGAYFLFPSPYHQLDLLRGQDKEATATSAQLRGIYFLKKANRTCLETISRKKAVSMIIKRHIHYFSYLSAQAKLYLFDLFLNACDNLPIHTLHFGRDENVLDTIIRK